jgi:hypothetical protein
MLRDQKGAHYGPVRFPLPKPSPGTRNALVANFLSHSPRGLLSEPPEDALFWLISSNSCEKISSYTGRFTELAKSL